MSTLSHGDNVLIWHYSQNTHLIFYGLWHVSDVLNASQHGSCGRGKIRNALDEDEK
jgi:hypothetical protein